jgi:hypothetical protein
MRNARFWRLAVIITTAGGLSLAGAGTALAGGGARSDLDVTISTASTFVPVSGDTLVRFGAPAPENSAHVSGTVTGIPAGLTLLVGTLLEEKFGETTFTATTEQADLRPLAGSAAYTFPVTPTLATSYEVEVSQSATSAPLRTSGPRTVYVLPDLTAAGVTCTRPSCAGKLVITAHVPPAAFGAESLKKLNVYQRLSTSADSTPAEPQTLSLAATARAVSRDAAKSTVQYSYRYGFNIGSADGYQWRINYCTPDAETTDGVGLPGSHDCGDPAVSTADPYLG